MKTYKNGRKCNKIDDIRKHMKTDEKGRKRIKTDENGRQLKKTDENV